MDLSKIRFELRKRRLDEIFEFGIVVLKYHVSIFLKLLSPWLILLFVINSFLIYGLHELDSDSGEAAGFFPFLFMTIVLIFEICFLELLLVILNSRLLFEQDLTVRSIYESRAGWIRFFFKGVLWRGTLVTFLSPFIVTLWFGYIKYFFLAEAIMLERLSGKNLSHRLSALTARANIVSFWFLTLTLFFIYIIVSYIILSEIVSLIGITPDPYLLSFSSASILLQPLILAYVVYHSTVKFLFYIDTRSHIEGWDLELQIRRGLNQSLDKA